MSDYTTGISCPSCGSPTEIGKTKGIIVCTNTMCYKKVTQISNEKWKELDSEINKRKYGNGGGCYVATCVYGSYDCPSVWTLRRFRDEILAKSWAGRSFVRIYYAISPKLVASLGSYEGFKRVCKPCIDLLVAKLQKSGIDDSPYSK